MMGSTRVRYLILCTAFLGLGGYSAHLSSRIGELEKHVRDQQNEAMLLNMEHALRAPEESILHGGKLDRNITELRQQYYEQHEISQTLPFNNISRVDCDLRDYPDGRLMERWSIDSSNLSNASVSHWWLNSSANALTCLYQWLENGRPHYGNMPSPDTDMDVIRTRIRPLVIRWLRAYHTGVRLDAARVLLAMGDSSPELTEIVQLATRHRPKWAAKIGDKYNLVIPDEAGRDSEQRAYTMEEFHSDWKRTRDLTNLIEQDTHRDYLKLQKRAKAAVEAAKRNEPMPGI